MEHIIQLGVSVDDDRIEKSIVELITFKIGNKIIDDMNRFTQTHGWAESDLEKMFREEVKAAVDAQREEIIEEAIERAVAGITRTKVFREKMKDETMEM